MKLARCIMLALAVVAFGTVSVPCCLAQDAAPSSQPAPAVSGSGQTNHVAVWKSSTTLGNSGIVATGGNVGIGTTAPAAKLEVNGDAQVDGNFDFAGSILLSGAPLVWSNKGLSNLSVGLEALPANTTGGQNTAVGQGVLHFNTTGNDNTGVGEEALLFNTAGNSNTATGQFALYSNTTGSFNTATGGLALSDNTTGSYNTATGQVAMYLSATGNNNVAVGRSALQYDSGDNNTAVGYYGLLYNTAGSYNTGIGSSALFSNTDGNYNTACGVDALYYSTTGSNNIAVGYQAGYNLGNDGYSGSNNIHIGNRGTVTDSGTIRIGTPLASGCMTCQTSAFIAGIYGTMTGLAGVSVVVDANGQLGTVSSSRRYKEDIQDMSDASNGLLRLRPVTFQYKKVFDDGSKPIQYGLIAEEVAEIYPDLVARNADGQVETVKYQLLDPMLLNEFQKQHATIEAQKDQIRSLEDRLARVEAALRTTQLTAAAK